MLSDGAEGWSVSRVRANNDRFTDIRIEQESGRVDYHLGTPRSTFARAPRLTGDEVYLSSRFVYQVTEANGVTAATTVYLRWRG